MPRYQYPKGKTHPNWKGGVSLDKKQWRKQWLLEHLDYFKKWNEVNRNKRRQFDIKYGKNPKRKLQKLEANRRWREKNKEKHRERNKFLEKI